MKSKFRLADIPLLLKTDRRFQIGAVILALVLLWPLIDPTKDNRQTPLPRLQAPAPEPGAGRIRDDEAAKDIMEAFKSEVSETRQEVKQIGESLKEEIEQRKQDSERAAEIFRRIIVRFNQGQTDGQQVASNGVVPPEDLALGDGTQTLGLEDGGLTTFGDSNDPTIQPLPPPPKKEVFIGAGDSVRVKLLSGVNAPTEGTPYPVVFKLVGDIAGPDGSTLPLGEARIVAAAQGSLVDSRALFRMTSMNIRFKNGRRKVVEVDGWIVGEDGIRGMEGKLHDPIGAAIAGGAMTGALAGLGEGLSASNSTTSTTGLGGSSTVVSGSIAQFAAGKAVSRSAKTWEEIIKERLDLMVPVVEVLSDREATAVFAKNVVIPDLFESIDEEDSGFYDSLD